ncbi:MAG: GLUG motif-containing protein, partial [Thermoplasmatota archaeon]
MKPTKYVKKTFAMMTAFLLVISLFIAIPNMYDYVEASASSGDQDVSFIDTPVKPRFSGTGSGTELDPYIITNVSQLQEMNDNLTAHYALANDIDASETSGWNGGEGFESIGDDATRFTGSLDGNNFTISDMFIYRNKTDYVGLFGYVEDAEIKNFGLTDVDITGANFTGSLYGMGGGTFYNLYSTGEVSGGHHVGGLVGFFREIGSTLSDSHTTVDTAASSYNVGGLVGRKSYGNIERCHASGDVSGTTSIGGLMGTNSGETVRYSYSTGDVSGRDSVGGFVGSTSSNGNIFNSYSTGTVTRTEFSQISIAGFCGR